MDNTNTNLRTRIDMAKMPAPLMSNFDKKLSNLLRWATPFIPNNVGNYLRKKTGLPTKIDNESIDQMRKAALYKSVENAIKRTGKERGGTEYEDYNTTEGYKQQIMNAKAGKINPFIGAFLGGKDAAYDMATTLGRVSYDKDKEGNIKITDTYDFKNNYTQDKLGAMKKDYMKDRSDFYGKERKKLAEEAQNEKITDKDKTVLYLSPKDTIGYADYLKSKRDIALFAKANLLSSLKKKK